MEMNLESIKKYVNEKVTPVDFLKILTEAEPEEAGPEDKGVEDDTEDLEGGDGTIDDLGGPDGDGGDDFGGSDDFGGDTAGGLDAPSGDSGESLEDETNSDTRFADRDDDPDFIGSSSDTGSAAEGNPAGSMIYDVEAVLKGLNNTISSSDVDLEELDRAKNVLEVVANGKKLRAEDFDEIKDEESFSDIINRSLFQADEKTQNYFKMKIKRAILDAQIQKKLDAAKQEGEVDSMRDLASKF